MSMRSMRVVKSEKRSWMALWQLLRLPRRITQALAATDCQQDRREAAWMTYNTNTHIHLFGSVSCNLVSISPVPFSSLFLPGSTVLFSSLFFHSYNFPSLCPASLLSLALPSERRGHRQVTYAPSFGLFCIVRHGQSSRAKEMKIYRRRHNPIFYRAHSLHLLAIYLLLTSEKVLF